MGISRASLYYISKQNKNDWALKIRMEEELRRNPAYGSRRLAQALGVNRKRTKRAMKLFGIKPYRRRGRRYKRIKAKRSFPNLLLTIMPSYENHIWATDFTEIVYHGKKVYASTIIDLFTRKIVGAHVAVRKGSTLTMQTLGNALFHNWRPVIFHSDNGSEYNAMVFVGTLEECGIVISRSRPGCPWENGYQESFYGKFKVDLGDPNRFDSFGELIAEIYQTLWRYNHTRIHSALKMPPAMFAQKMAA
jgi:transposase InsO family protein